MMDHDLFEFDRLRLDPSKLQELGKRGKLRQPKKWRRYYVPFPWAWVECLQMVRAGGTYRLALLLLYRALADGRSCCPTCSRPMEGCPDGRNGLRRFGMCDRDSPLPNTPAVPPVHAQPGRRPKAAPARRRIVAESPSSMGPRHRP
jgi:hypothetical protein